MSKTKHSVRKANKPAGRKGIEAIIAAARIRGQALQEKMIIDAGGLLKTAQAAEAAKLSSRALYRRKNKSLLAVQTIGRQIGWPKFQFESDEMLQAVGRVLRKIEVDSPWMRLNFFLMHLDELGNQRPIDAIRLNMIEQVERAAAHFGIHGGS